MKSMRRLLFLVIIMVIISGCIPMFLKVTKLMLSSDKTVCFVGDKVFFQTVVEHNDGSLKNIHAEILVNGSKLEGDVFEPVEAGHYQISSRYNGVLSNTLDIEVQDYKITILSDKSMTEYKIGETATFSYVVKDKNEVEKKGIICDIYEGDTKLSGNTYKFDDRRGYTFTARYGKTSSNKIEKIFPLPKTITIFKNMPTGKYWIGETVVLSSIAIGEDGMIMEDVKPEYFDDKGNKVGDSIQITTAGSFSINANYKGIITNTLVIESCVAPEHMVLASNKSVVVEQDETIILDAKAYDKDGNIINTDEVKYYVNGIVLENAKYSLTNSGINVIVAKWRSKVSNQLEINVPISSKRVFTYEDKTVTANLGEYIDTYISVSGVNIKGYGVEVLVSYDTNFFVYDDVSDGGIHKASMISSSVDGKIWGLKVIKEDEPGKIIVAAMGMDYGTTISGQIIKIPMRVRDKKGISEIKMIRANILRGDNKGYMGNVDATDVGIIEIN